MILKSTPWSNIKIGIRSTKRDRRSKKKSVIQWLFLPLLLFLYSAEMAAQCSPTITSTTFNINLSGSSEPFDETDIAAGIVPGTNCCPACGNDYIIFNQMTAPNGGDSGTTSAAGAATGISLDCTNLGSNTMWIVVKGNGGLVYDVGIDSEPIMITVNVSDTAPPTLTCPAGITANVDAGTCTSMQTPAAPTMNDNCGATLTYAFAGVTTGSGTGLVPLTAFNVGTTTITYTATENAGGMNTATCAVTVVISDNQAPVVNCPLNKSVNVDAGMCIATDITGISMNFESVAGDVDAPGEYFECNPSVSYDLTGATTGSGTGASAGTYLPGFEVGVTTVTYTVTDQTPGGAATTCSFTVTVLDDVAPSISCPMNIDVNNDHGECAAVVSYATPVGMDNCGTTVQTIQTAGLPDGSSFPVGTTTNTFMVASPTGNTISVATSIAPNGPFTSGLFTTIFDVVTAPIFLESITIYPTGADNINITIVNNDGDLIESVPVSTTVGSMVVPINKLLDVGTGYQIVHDGASELLQRSNPDALPQSSSFLNITGNFSPVFGSNSRLYYFFDWKYKATQTEDCSFDVVVNDTELPTIGDCLADISVNTLLGDCEQVVSWNPPSIFDDNCGIKSITVAAEDENDVAITIFNTTPANCDDATDFTVAWNPANWTEELNGGNGTTAFSGTTSLTITGSDSATDSEICISVAYDGIIEFSSFSNTGGGGADISYISLNATTFNLGNGNGNNNFTGLLPVEAGDELCFGVISNGFGTEQTLVIDDFSYTCSAEQTTGTFPAGTNTVTYTVTDIHDNIGTCSFDIVVTDAEAPTISCPADQIIPSICANTPISDFTDLVSAFDACGLPVVTQFVQGAGMNSATTLGEVMVPNGTPGGPPFLPLSLTDGATFTMTFIATDGNSNTETCTITVTLDDQDDPIPSVAGPLSPVSETACAGTFNYPAPSATAGCTGINVPENLYATATPIQPGITYVPPATMGGQPSYDFAPGSYTVTWRYEDDSTPPNVTEQVQFFTITGDTEVPTCLAQDVSKNVSATAPASVVVLATEVDMNSVDNCGIATYEIALDDGNGNYATQLTFDCDDIGSSIDVLLKVTDTSNNSSTCEAKVTISDVTAPSFTCPPNGNFTSNCSNYTINNNTYDPTDWMDNCGVASVTHDYNTANSNSLNGANFNNGTTTVIWTITDDNGLSHSCSQTITVTPQAGGTTVSSCGTDSTVGISEDFSPSDCFYRVGDLNPGEFDAVESNFGCNGFSNATHNFVGAGMYSSTSLDGAMLPVGITTVQWSISGSVACTVVITVTDDVAPVLTCASNIALPLPINGEIDLNAPGIQGLLTSYFDCSMNVTLNVSPGTLDCDAVGVATPISITADDGNGNVAICNTSIEIQDNTDPVALCQAASVSLDDNGSGSLDAEDMDGGSSDACGPLTFLVALDDLGGGVNNDQPDGIADDAFAASIPFGCGDEGTHNVILKVIDDHGNETTCNETVTVTDGGAPTALCQNFSISLDELTGEATITSDDIDNGSSDACNNPVTLAFKVDALGLGYATSHTFDCGDVTGSSSSYTATLRVTDNASPSSSSTCTATITINHAAPVALCQDYTAVLDANGSVTVTTANLNDGSYDVCGNTLTYQIAVDADEDGAPDDVYANSIDFDCDQTGEHTVLLEVTDEYGKKDVCTSTVTVSDNILPTVTCMDIVISLDGNGNAVINGTNILDAVSDNCDVIQLTPSQTQFDCSDIGVNMITLVATDQNQNTGSCIASVTVEDNTDPVVITQNVQINLDASGNASINSFEIDGGSNDACGILSVSASQTDFDCMDVGTNVVILTVTDNNNNSATGTATVTVVDNIAPTASCMNITVDLDATATLTVEADDVDNGSADACGGGILTYSIAIDVNEDGDADDGEVFSSSLDYDCTNIGDNYVIMRVTDENDNFADCDAMITIETVLEDVGLAVGDVDGCQTDVVKVPVTVSNFNNMLGIQADFTVVDATVGTVLGVSDMNLDNLDAGDFVITGNVVNLVWFNGSPTNVDDDVVIFNIDVELIGDPNPVDLTSAVDITNAILGQDLCGNLVEPGAAITNGSVLIDCEPSSINLTGNVVKAGNLAPVNNVLFTLSGDVSGTQTGTLPTSEYDFIVDAGLDATITPSKGGTPNAGNINIIDLLTIQSNILGTPLPVYKLIAADVTDDGSVNILDLFTIQAFILGAPDFGAVDAWAFVPEDYVFADPTSPTPQSSFDSYVNYNPTAADEDDTFLAIEMGDVTDDAPAPFVGGGTDPMYFYLEDRPVVAGEDYAVTFRADDFQNIAGYQFTLGFDTDFLYYANASVDQLTDLSLDQFGLSQLDEGKIPSLWYNFDGVSMGDGEALFTITFTALQDAAKLSDLLSINTSDIEAFAYTKSSEKRNLELAYTNTTSTSTTLDNGFKLFPNTPNPFISETTIAYRLDEASEVSLTIMDVAGKVIRQIQSNGAVSGYQEVTIDHSDLQGSGVYFYKLETSQHAATGKMTLINH